MTSVEQLPKELRSASYAKKIASVREDKDAKGEVAGYSFVTNDGQKGYVERGGKAPDVYQAVKENRERQKRLAKSSTPAAQPPSRTKGKGK